MRALLLDPGGLEGPGHYDPSDVAFRILDGVGHHTQTLSGLNHTAHTLAVYASQHAVARDHARLASGCLARLGRTGFNPRGSKWGFVRS